MDTDLGNKGLNSAVRHKERVRFCILLVSCISVFVSKLNLDHDVMGLLTEHNIQSSGDALMMLGFLDDDIYVTVMSGLGV